MTGCCISKRHSPTKRGSIGKEVVYLSENSTAVETLNIEIAGWIRVDRRSGVV
jgi:hypothetical protein